MCLIQASLQAAEDFSMWQIYHNAWLGLEHWPPVGKLSRW